MKKKLLSLLAFVLLMSTSVKAQNNIWAMPNHDGSQGYYLFGDPAPTAFPTTNPQNNYQPYTDPFVGGYMPSATNGQHWHRGSANAINGVDGQLLFFYGR